MTPNKRKIKAATIITLFFLDVFVWISILDRGTVREPAVYFLNVGQGDSELVVLENNVKILIDGGPGTAILERLAEIFPPQDRYIDLVVLSHPQLDHFAGLIDVMKRYEIGAFIYNGRRGEARAFNSLINILDENKTAVVILKEDDKISYQDNVFEIISPSVQELASKELNDTSFVILGTSGGYRILFTGDIGFKTEDRLVKEYDLDIDVLKVAHHGSKYATGAAFLKEAAPRISVIEVGKNSYGHPAPETLERLKKIGSGVYRTDKEGTIRLK